MVQLNRDLVKNHLKRIPHIVSISRCLNTENIIYPDCVTLCIYDVNFTLFYITSINKNENKVYIFTCFTHFNQNEQRQFFLSILVKMAKYVGYDDGCRLFPDMKSSVTIILSKLCYQMLIIMIIIYEDTLSSLAYAICASVSLI